MTEAKASITIICGSCHGLRTATLAHEDSVTIFGTEVTNVDVYRCCDCGGVACLDPASALRFREAAQRARARQ